ncbi:MAG: glucosyltransferase domain-containing protein, partial [Lachnospiraceae bacterium]|nr:glucosyltransferase domain-containing protein [Lachnospiraceae bacterium]
KFSFQDDITYANRFGTSAPEGRWSLDILEFLMRILFRGKIYSLPLFNGIIALIIIGCMTCLLIRLFEIKNCFVSGIMSAIFATMPSIVGLFGYMFMAYVWALAYFLTVLSFYFVQKNRGWKNFFISVGILVFALGMYQAVLAYSVSIIVLYMISEHLKKNDSSWKSFFVEGFYYLGYIVSGIILYVIVMKISTFALKTKVTGEQGVDTLGLTNLTDFWKRIIKAYMDFFIPRDNFPLSVKYIYLFMIFIVLCIAINLLIRVFKKDATLGIQLLVLMTIFPMASNFIDIMCDPNFTNIHIIMQYSQSLVYLAAVILIRDSRNYIIKLNSFLGGVFYKLCNVNIRICIMIGICIILLNSRFANICYMKMNYMQTQGISYFTELKMRIHMVEGYEETLSVAFINEHNKQTEQIETIEVKDANITPYYIDLINESRWLGFMNTWCGYAPNIIDDTESLSKDPIVQQMPNYPKKGSIRRIGDVIVVKF